MDWDGLRTLLAVARSRTLSEAGNLLGVNQTTVSRRLDALEEALAIRLVDRSRDGVRLSASGERALEAAEQVEDILFGLERDVVGGDTLLTGSLRVTTTDMIATYHPDLFATFAHRYPDVSVDVATDYREESLARREADVAIRWSNRPDQHLFGRKLVRAEYAVYGATKLVKQHGKRADLGRYPWIAWGVSSRARATERWMKKHVPTARVMMRVDSALAMHAAVRQGCGVAFMPCIYGDDTPGLTRLRPIEAGFGYDIWALTHPDLKGTARVRAFLEHTGSYFDERAAGFAGRRR